jgi:hypothetical protein
LAAALSFTTHAFLPPALLTSGVGHWQRMAQALARVVAEGAPPGADAQPDKNGRPQATGGALP